MGTVIEFKRPTSALQKPGNPPERQWRAIWLDNFDDVTRYLADPSLSRQDFLDYINYWRERWAVEPL